MGRATAAVRPLMLASVLLLAAACASAGYKTATDHKIVPAGQGAVLVPNRHEAPLNQLSAATPYFRTPEQAVGYVIAAYNRNDDHALQPITSKAGRDVISFHRTFAMNLRLERCYADTAHGVQQCLLEFDELPDASGKVVHLSGAAGQTSLLFRQIQSSGWQMIGAVDCAGKAY